MPGLNGKKEAIVAKRHAKFSDLQGVSGRWHAPGTLGTHFATVVPQGDAVVVIGSRSGRVTLKEGDTLGYDRGEVWIVSAPSSYKDPIRRALAEAHLGQRLLVYSADPVEYTSSWQDTSSWPENSAADPSTGEDVLVLGEHKSVTLEADDRYNTRRISGGDVVVVRQAIGMETTSERPRRTVRIVVRPSSDKVKVAEWILDTFTEAGRERRRAKEESAREESNRLYKEVASRLPRTSIREEMVEIEGDRYALDTIAQYSSGAIVRYPAMGCMEDVRSHELIRALATALGIK